MFCPAIGTKQFLYPLMVIPAYRGESHVTYEPMVVVLISTNTDVNCVLPLGPQLHYCVWQLGILSKVGLS